MNLILAIIDKFATCYKIRNLDLENYHNNKMQMDKLACKVIKSINSDVRRKLCGHLTSNYKKQEDELEKDSIVNFGMLTESNEFAKIMALMIKAVKVYSLYYQFENKHLDDVGISDREKENICKKLIEVEQILIYSILKYFADKQMMVEWKNNSFVINCKMDDGDLEIINCVCQVMEQCKMLKETISCGGYCYALQTCKQLNFDNIFDSKSIHLCYCL